MIRILINLIIFFLVSFLITYEFSYKFLFSLDMLYLEGDGFDGVAVNFYKCYLETCQAVVTSKATGKVYENLEIILIINKEMTKSDFKFSILQQFPHIFTFVNQQITYESWGDTYQSVFFMNSNFTSGECYRDFRLTSAMQSRELKTIFSRSTVHCTMYLNYQETEKFNLHNDGLYPLYEHFNEVTVELKGPFKKWECEQTGPLDIPTASATYNEKKKILKTSFIMPLCKSYGEVIVLISDPNKGNYDYSNAFKKSNSFRKLLPPVKF